MEALPQRQPPRSQLRRSGGDVMKEGGEINFGVALLLAGVGVNMS